jgi:Tfp pilus assembly protein PilZ
MIQQPKSGHFRIPYTQRCRVWRGGVCVTGVTCNISDIGVYVTLEDVPEVGERLELELPLPDGGQPVQVEGDVTWRNVDEPQRVTSLPPGCGVRFASLLPGDERRIQAIVQEYKDRVPPGIGAAVPESGAVRVPYIQRCRTVVGGTERSAVLCNLSVLGVYVTLDDPLPCVGERVEVAFRLPGDESPLKARCTVVWLNAKDPRKVDGLAPGCGLRFDLLSLEDRARVEQIVSEYSRPVSGPAR